MPQQAIPLHVLAEIQRAMAHASVVAKQAGGVALSPNDIFMQGEQSPYHSFALLSRYKLFTNLCGNTLSMRTPAECYSSYLHRLDLQ